MTKSAMTVLVVIADGNALGQPMVRTIKDFLSIHAEVLIIKPEGINSRAGAPVTTGSICQRARSIHKFTGLLVHVFLRFALKLLFWLVPIARRGGNSISPRVMGQLVTMLLPRRNNTAVAVDFQALLACQLVGINAHLLSLELLDVDICSWFVRPHMIPTCLTQSDLRYLALFPKGGPKKFVVPNFPRFRSPPINEEVVAKEGLVVAGTAFWGFGARAAINLVTAYRDLTITFCGGIPDELRSYVVNAPEKLNLRERVTFFGDYIDEENYLRRISKFKIGLCLYDFTKAETEFFGDATNYMSFSVTNYLTGFPGKIGMCVAAGIPVIASSWPGMEFVEEHKIGICVRDCDPATLRAAIVGIEQEYVSFQKNVALLANSRWFENALQPFLNYLCPASD